MGQIRYLDGEWTQFIERQTGQTSSGSTGQTTPTGVILFERRWTFEPIDIDGVSAELAGGFASNYLIGLYATDLSTGLPLGSPTWQAPSASTLTGVQLRSVTRAHLPGPKVMWAAFAQSAGAIWWGARNNLPPVDMGVNPLTGVAYGAYSAPWVYNSVGLPDVTGFTFTPEVRGTAFRTMPMIRFRTRR